ncbi:MAG: DUF262 domain-containing protein [Gemmatimonadota bacterium]|nr:DUF262 domain-containing protein [Gemmatimonadota bacterium]
MLSDFRSRINVDAEYQRGAVWSRGQQALLIDSIIRGFDIPKIFLRKLPEGGKHLFDVIDGKQRLTAIWAFVSDEFTLLRNTEPFPELGDLSGQRWSDLSDMARDRLQFTNITISKIEDATDDEIRELFLRLQRGEPLNAAERRHAMSGPLRDFVADHLASHGLWELTRLRAVRFGKDEHSAILLALVCHAGPTGLRGADLHRLYEMDHFDPTGNDAKRTLRLLDALRDVASVQPGAIRTRWGLVDLALVLLRLGDEEIPVPPDKLMEFFLAFERERRDVAEILADLQTRLVEPTEAERGISEEEDDVREQITPEMLTYHLAFAREGASKENVAKRANTMYARLRAFLEFTELGGQRR